MDATPNSAAAERLLDIFHSRTPIRAWSLIVTLYGDAIVPRGGTLWLGSLIEIMAAFRIGAGVVRTAMSRLAADGWLERNRIGRNSYYRLSEHARADFLNATTRFYHTPAARWDGRWQIAILTGDAAGRPGRRQALLDTGFAQLAANVFVVPLASEAKRHRAADIAKGGVVLLDAHGATLAEARDVAGEAWKLDPIAASYRRLIGQFAEVRAALADERLTGRDALIIRTLVVHEYRRVLWRDPLLPVELLPPDWPGHEVRLLCAAIYRAVVAEAEGWLDDNAEVEVGPLPAPDASFKRRFGGL